MTTPRFLTPAPLRIMLATSVALGTLAAARPVASQDLGAPHEVDTVVITSYGLGRTVGDILSHVDVISEQELQKTDGGLGERLASLPGIDSSFFGPGASRPIIRGLDGYRVQVLNNGLGVLDAASISADHAPSAEAMQASRVEIFRGPAALAFGGAAIGGVVNVIDRSIPSKLPTDPVNVRLDGFLSTADQGFGFTGESTMRHDKTAAHIGFSTRMAEDYEGPDGVEVDNSDLTSNLMSFGLAQHADKGFVGASIQQFETDYGVPGEDVSIDMEQTRVRLAGGYMFDGSPFERLDGSILFSDYTHAELEDGMVGTRFDVEGYEGRLELFNRQNGPHSGLLGVQYAEREIVATGDEAFLPATDARDGGLFVVRNYDRENWGLEGGARLDWAERETSTQSRDFTDWSAAFGGYYKPTHLTKVGLVLSRTTRAPAEAELFADGPHAATGAYEIGDSTLDNEQAWHAELSAQYRGYRLALDGHLFYADFDNYIDLVPTGGTMDDLPVFQFQESGAEFWGFEAHADWLAAEGDTWAWNIDLSAEYVEAETDAGDAPRIPPLGVTLGTTWSWKTMESRLEAQWVDEQDQVAAFESTTDGYTLVNASVRFEPRSWPFSVMVQGQNLTDETARRHTSFLKANAPLAGRGLRISFHKPL